MQNSMWVWIVGIVIVVGIGAYMFTQGGITMPAGAPADTTQQAGGTQSNSLSGLLALGASQKCTFSSETGTSASSGTVYVAGGSMRGDFTSTSNGQTVVSHMIVKGGTSYMWSSEMPQGIKMSFGSSSGGSGSQSGVDVNAQANYSCASWAPEQAQFELPAGITFMSMSDFTAPPVTP